MISNETSLQRKPSWIRVKAPNSKGYQETAALMRDLKLKTVCEEAACPNIGECWSKKHATMMILGDTCTRACTFCNIKTGRPDLLDPHEPERVGNAVAQLGLSHVVITSVDRDDLKDGGSTIWAETINTIRRESPGTTLETLIPDFRGVWDNLDRLLATRPEVVSHNLETVRRLTKEVRIQAKYDRSLECLRRINEAGLRTKSGIMLGLGETEEDVLEAMADLLAVGVHILTLGQYLQPSRSHHPVIDWITPEQFEKYKRIGLEMGFKYVESGPLVRSSYHAEKHLFEF